MSIVLHAAQRAQKCIARMIHAFKYRSLVVHIMQKSAQCATVIYSTLYNEERRLGDQRGSDTLVVPLITSNDGLSIAFIN